MTTHPSQHAARQVVAAELADAIESERHAWTAYQATPEYSEAEHRAWLHLVNCQGAIAAAAQRLAMFDRGRPAPARWGQQ